MAGRHDGGIHIKSKKLARIVKIEKKLENWDQKQLEFVNVSCAVT